MYWNTVTPLLQQVLEATMAAPAFDEFRLVGGTSLSLQLGHRISVDIDLFTDVNYGSVDFIAIDRFFKSSYAYVDTNEGQPVAMGTSYYVGESENEAVKIDLYYTDSFIHPILDEEGIRFASQEDIIGMKLEMLGHGGRKKDFWDLHMLHDGFSISEMISLYFERYPYSYTEAEIRVAFTNFIIADDDLDPICLLNKHRELIKLAFINWLAI